MKRLILSLLLTLPIAGQAIDLENGRNISKRCALCHGAYGQGTPGPASPRLAGMPSGYTIKQLEAYKAGSRINPRMTITASLHNMSEEDMDDVAAYYESINLEKVKQGLGDVPPWPGDVERGADIYDESCKSCHRKDGMGKSRKGIPAISLQYSQYLYRQIKMFQWDKRVHDDDPDDETFDLFEDKDIEAILAYVSSLAPNNQK